MENLTDNTKNILNKLFIFNEKQLENILKDFLEIREIINKYKLYTNNLKTINQFQDKISYLYNFEKDNKYKCYDLKKENDELKKKIINKENIIKIYKNQYEYYDYFNYFKELDYNNNFYENYWIDHYKYFYFKQNKICINKNIELTQNKPIYNLPDKIKFNSNQVNNIIYPKISINIIKNLNIKESNKRFNQPILKIYKDKYFIKRCYIKWNKYVKYLIKIGKPEWEGNMLAIHEQIKNNIHRIPDNNQHLNRFNNNFDNIALYANDFIYYIENEHIIKLYIKLKSYKERKYTNEIIKSIYETKYNKVYKLVNLGNYFINNKINHLKDIEDEDIKEFIKNEDTKPSRSINYIKKITYLNKHINIKCLIDLNLKQTFRELSINNCNQLLDMLQ